MGGAPLGGNAFFLEIVVFDLQTAFFHGKTVFFRFLAEIRLGTPIYSPQKEVLDPKLANSVPPAPCFKLQSGNKKNIDCWTVRGVCLEPKKIIREFVHEGLVFLDSY